MKASSATSMTDWLQQLKASRAGRLFWSRSFLDYAWVSALFSLANIFFLWLFIDVLRIPTVISSVIVIGGTFVLRYVLFRLIKIV